MTFDVPTLQLVSYTALTCASITVAAVSCYTAYRQHRGWKPIILMTHRGRNETLSAPRHGLLVVFEVWNRRKYPIVLDEVTIAFQRFTFSDMPGMENDPQRGVEIPYGEKTLWFRDGRNYTTYPSDPVGSNEHAMFHIDAPYQLGEDAKTTKEIARVTVRYFDPIGNRYLKIKSQRISL
jgi:hypothetical protein